MNLRAKILAALAVSDMDAHSLADACECAYRSLYNGERALGGLRDDAEIHVCAWIRAERRGGSPQPIFRLGPGIDAPRPKPLPNSAKTLAYRKRHPKKVAESQRKWKAKSRERINKVAKVAKYRREGTPIVEAIDPLLAAMMRPLAEPRDDDDEDGHDDDCKVGRITDDYELVESQAWLGEPGEFPR